MKVLILGGTAHLGRAIATAALGRGWDVTCLARGSAAAPDGVTFVRADRDSPDGLDAVAHQPWDAVVDVTCHPGHARRAVEQLDARHWVFISSANAYAHYDQPEQDESGATHDPLDAEMLTDPEQYGPAKVACENAFREADAPATIVRLGLLTGPGDDTGRCGYYPWRFAHPTGPDVLVPPDPTFPCAFIDVDDLVAWLLTCIETRLDGTFNATGPTIPLGEVLALSRNAAGSALPVTEVPRDVLDAAGVRPWMGPDSLPLWIPDPAWRFFATLNTSAARAHGLVTRPYADTIARVLADQNALPEPPASGLSDDLERRLRAALTHSGHTTTPH